MLSTYVWIKAFKYMYIFKISDDKIMIQELKYGYSSKIKKM